jgi:hypothetical protein
MSRRRWNWVWLLAPLVAALVVGNVLAFAAASGDEDRLLRAFIVFAIVIVLSLAVAARGASRIYSEYTRTRRQW